MFWFVAVRRCKDLGVFLAVRRGSSWFMYGPGVIPVELCTPLGGAGCVPRTSLLPFPQVGPFRCLSMQLDDPRLSRHSRTDRASRRDNTFADPHSSRDAERARRYALGAVSRLHISPRVSKRALRTPEKPGNVPIPVCHSHPLHSSLRWSRNRQGLQVPHRLAG